MNFMHLKKFVAYSSLTAFIASGVFFSICKEKATDYAGYIDEYSKNVDGDDFFIAAHRGHCDDYVENSIQAIANAADSDFVDFLEFDVRLTRDNQLVVVHNNQVTEVDGSNLCISDSVSEDILDSSFVYLSANDFKNFFSSYANDIEGQLIRNRFFSSFGNNYCISSLEQILDVCGTKSILLDLKFNDDFVQFEQALFPFLDNYGGRFNIVLQSADLDSLKKLQMLHPEYSYLGIINSKDDFDYCESFDMIGIRKNLISDERTIDALKDGKRISVWTVNSVDELHDIVSTLGSYFDEAIYVTDYPKVISAELSKIYNKK